MRDYIIDGHSDVLLNFSNGNYQFTKVNPAFQVDLPRLKQGHIGLEVFAVCIEERYLNYFALERTIQLIDRFYNLLEKNEQLYQIKNHKDLEIIEQEDKIGALLAIEGADGVFDLAALRTFYRLGVRLITLTWNYRNHLADGVCELAANGGVTSLGKKVIEEMNRLGMIIDVSHLTPASFWDVIKYSSMPVVASHSNAKALCKHPRNLTDEQIIALAEKKGLIGINFCPEFLNKSGKADINDVIKHINYIRDLVGIDYIGLGTDFDGISSTPEGLEDISRLPELKTALLKGGYKQEDVQKIFQSNWLNIFKELLL